MWLAGAASLLASQRPGAESADVNTLQEKQKKLRVGKHIHLSSMFVQLRFSFQVSDYNLNSFSFGFGLELIQTSFFFGSLLQEVQKDLQAKREGIAEAIRSAEEFLAERGESLSPEEKENLQRTLTKMKEQYGALTDSTNTSLTELDTAINTTMQQNTQRVRE